MANPGDRVKVKTAKEAVEGILMPSAGRDVVIIKLDSGYNLGLKKKDVKKIAVVKSVVKREEHPKEKHTPPKVKVAGNSQLPTIAILHTGGTIASKVDYRTGGVTTSFRPEELLSLFPELKGIAHINSELIAQMWSDDLRFAHFAIIARKIEQQVKKGVRGIIIGMGTDNLAVAAAALAFIVEKSPVPIVFVGAQRSSDRGSSDAAINLICAAEFVTKTDFGGVALCMHSGSGDDSCDILPATKTYKLHSSRRDAFKVINTLPLASVRFTDRAVVFHQKDYPKRSTELSLKPEMEEKVGLLKIHINMFPEQFEFYRGYKGLVIEGTGLGHTPGQVPTPETAIHKRIYPALRKLADSGCIIVMTTQCLFGGVNMNVYDKGRDLLDIGVIPGKDMLAHTAFVKLSWLLAQYPPKEAKALFTQNLRGEINERIKYAEDFLQ